MKIVRSILAVVFGVAVAMVGVNVGHAIGHAIYPPPEAMKDSEAFKKLLANPEELQKVIDELPAGALVAVLISWQLGAFLGGATAALVAAARRSLHAGVIGMFILLASVAMMMLMPHPVWMKVAGLLLPLPVSLLAGKLVSLLLPAPLPSASQA